MDARVVIGANRTFALKNAVLLYGDGMSMFATLHSIKMRVKSGAPHLGPGQALTTAFLKTLAEGLGVRSAVEILPENVLARTQDMIAWWMQPRREVMFFGGVDPEARGLDGGTYPSRPYRAGACCESRLCEQESSRDSRSVHASDRQREIHSTGRGRPSMARPAGSRDGGVVGKRFQLRGGLPLVLDLYHARPPITDSETRHRSPSRRLAAGNGSQGVCPRLIAPLQIH